ncbi:MAG: citrate lyase subunit alpha [Candidatus Cloacimonetes bacterium]|nr:citrate lyase subunit alpha [Candidatus Cloacimonadota bacterium]MCF7813338.1 citrate lyase subunit alpha [Candidatus Cloacimonadota bacterium]MCF7867827.1 citrate lyase subunit alpha [Candidatus Cloacimonadota bacterium]MCF7883287.1 citrate lyase subunit alpha [Candidatus Cloacimonadota bacterium]
MKKADKFVKNAAGRVVPTIVNGREVIAFQGVGKYKPTHTGASPRVPTSADYPKDGNKIVENLKEALSKAGIKDGMTISTHHHYRNGDFVSNLIFDIAAELGVKNLRWLPSAAFPCNEPLIKHLESGVIHHIEGSLNGPLGNYCSHGKMKGMGYLRSHGGRYRAISDGEVHVDIAVMCASAADMTGNANGILGKHPFGPMGFTKADVKNADKTIVVTDTLIPYPCYPWEIMGSDVDYVVMVDKIGDPDKIVSGTTRITKSPDRLLIAEYCAKFVDAAGIVKDGFCFQAGAGGTSLAFVKFVKEIMLKKGIKARAILGGNTKYQVELLKEGLTDYLLEGQAFDLETIKSIRDNANHIALGVFESYDYHSKGNIASMMDAIVLGSTEVDVNFNANCVSHSDGRMLHGIGGFQNCMMAKCTILTVPSFRDRIPVIKDKVTTLVAPGEMVDVIITERGICINPLRKDLIEATKDSGLPIRDIHDLKAEIDAICGTPAKPKLTNEAVAVVEWVDGTILDTIWKVEQ